MYVVILIKKRVDIECMSQASFITVYGSSGQVIGLFLGH